MGKKSDSKTKGGGKKSGSPSRKARRARSWLRGEARKDRNVFKSSHGKYLTRAAMAAGKRIS